MHHQHLKTIRQAMLDDVDLLSVRGQDQQPGEKETGDQGQPRGIA